MTKAYPKSPIGSVADDQAFLRVSMTLSHHLDEIESSYSLSACPFM